MIKTITLNSDSTPKIKPATSRIFVFDVSGSMYGSLPQMKKHLKDKLFTQIPENDDITILYFSGRGEYGVIAEGVNVSKVKDLKAIYASIDKLTTIGLTGFLEPLKEVGNVVKRLPAGNVKELFFLTDGYDNQWSEKEILAQCQALRDCVDHAYFVEYGWYCNRALIAKMAEILSATHLFSEDYVAYADLAERVVKEGVTKKMKIQLASRPYDGFAFYLYNGNIAVVNADEENQILVPEDLDTYYFIDEQKPETVEPGKEVYMALFALASRKDSSAVYDLLKRLGDVRFIQQYTNAYSKQDLTRFLEEVTLAVTEEKERMTKGCNYNLVPSEDAYNVLEFLQDLMDGENRLFTDHEDFQYKRISRAKEAVSVEERVAKAKEKLSAATDLDSLKAETEKMMTLLNTEDLKFEPKKDTEGVAVSNLTWNEDRPNVSVLVRREGSVQLPKNSFGADKLDTFIYRNYAIIQDGILNMNTLPLSLSESMFKKLQEKGLLQGEVYEHGKVYSVDFSSLPVINRQMVKTVSAKEVFTYQLELETLKAHAKVFKYYLNELEPKTSVGWEAKYGKEAVTWLKEMGLTEYNGFSPKSKSVESTDFYIGKALKIKVKGLSALPKVADIEKLLKEGKKASIKDLAMIQAVKEYQALSDKKNEEKVAFLKEKLESIKKKDKKISLALSKIKFATIIGQTWFKEFADDTEATMDLDYLGTTATVSAELNDIEVKI